MKGTISVVFLLHSVLCCGYVSYLVAGMGRWLGHRLADETGGLEAVLGSDERRTTIAAHGTLLLYLAYAEVYLYHSWKFFTY
jgi:hypothetical protein